jgi:type VI protein secretion system component Hcp
MTRHILAVALALLVALSAAAYADAGEKGTQTKKGHTGSGPIVFVKHYDKASPYLNLN